jgi:hypothetical protein
MMLRNSERQSFKTCRHRWQWVYLDGRQSIEAPRALRFGDLIHQALAAYYKKGTKRGPKPAGVYERLYNEQAAALEGQGFNVWSDDKWIDALPLGIGMLEGYVKRFSEEDKEWEVVSTEQTFQLLITTPNGLRFKVVGTFDGVWRHRGNGRIIFREFNYRFLRKAIPNPDKKINAQGHVLNKDGSVSKSQPAPYFSPSVPVYRDQVDRERVHARVCAEAEDIARARAGKLALYKNPGPLHMPNCLGCAVRDACELHETGGDYEAMLEMTMTDWNPYAAHELPERH